MELGLKILLNVCVVNVFMGKGTLLKQRANCGLWRFKCITARCSYQVFPYTEL